MSFTISTLTLEAFLLVLVRVACFTSIAPIFGHNSLNARMKISIAFFVSLILYQVVDVSLPEYTNVLVYTTLVLEEALVGLLLGFVAGLSMKALAIAGEFIDREIGFSMATTFDPNQGMVTITGELYDKIVCLVIMISNLHYYILSAAAQSFELVPVGRIVLSPDVIYTVYRADVYDWIPYRDASIFGRDHVECHFGGACKEFSADEHVRDWYAVESICWFIFACCLYYVRSEHCKLYYGTYA